MRITRTEDEMTALKKRTEEILAEATEQGDSYARVVAFALDDLLIWLTHNNGEEREKFLSEHLPNYARSTSDPSREG